MPHNPYATRDKPMFESHEPAFVPPHLRWKYTKLLPGTNLSGWLAGPFVGVIGHWVNGTKPCRLVMTKGALQCVCETSPFAERWVGHVPLLDRSYRQVVIGIGPDAREILKTIPVGASIKASKGKAGTAPTMIHPDDIGFPCERIDLDKPSDIREWLLTLWGDTDLAQWIKDNPVATPVSEAHRPLSLKERRDLGKAEIEKGAELLRKRLRRDGWKDEVGDKEQTQ